MAVIRGMSDKGKSARRGNEICKNNKRKELTSALERATGRLRTDPNSELRLVCGRTRRVRRFGTFRGFAGRVAPNAVGTRARRDQRLLLFG